MMSNLVFFRLVLLLLSIKSRLHNILFVHFPVFRGKRLELRYRVCSIYIMFDDETWTKIYACICIVVQRNGGVVNTLRDVCPFESYTLVDTILEEPYLIIFTNSIVQVYIASYYVAWSKGIAIFIVTGAVVHFGPFQQ